MASSRKKARRGRAAGVVVLCLLLVCAVALGTVYLLLNRKVTALQKGAQFSFSYEVTSDTDAPPALYNVLEQVGALQGEVSGLYAPSRLQLSLALQSTPAEPITHLYIDETETLYDVGQLYNTVRRSLSDAYPIAGMLLPDWTLGDYISQTQIAQALGVELQTVELQDMAGFTLSLTALKKVQPENAKEGYLYVMLPGSEENAPQLILGLPWDSLFAEETPLHVLLAIPKHGVHIQLTGSLCAQETAVVAPSSRMKDEDIATFAQIRQTVEELLRIVQNATASLQNPS